MTSQGKNLITTGNFPLRSFRNLPDTLSYPILYPCMYLLLQSDSLPVSVFRSYVSLVHTLSRRRENFGVWRKKGVSGLNVLIRNGISFVLIIDWHHLHHLDSYWKCRFMDLTLDLQNQVLQSGAQQSKFYQILRMVLVQTQVWEKLLPCVFPSLFLFYIKLPCKKEAERGRKKKEGKDFLTTLSGSWIVRREVINKQTLCK